MKKSILFIAFLLCGHHLFAQSITGTTGICAGAGTTLSNTTTGGVWTSASAGVATIDSFSGDVSGLSAGTSVITYYYPGSGFATTTVTVNPLPAAIMGAHSVCMDAGATCTDATTGGTWSSSNNFVAIIDGTGMATGLSVDTVTVMYTLGTGCAAYSVLTVNPLPIPISGSGNYCVGATDSLYETGGGTWTTDATGIIALGSVAGDITGVAAGVATVTYTLPGGCSTTLPVNVTAQPYAGTITAASIICMGNTTIAVSDACCGIWSSSDVSVATVGSITGVVTSVSPGTVAIGYEVTNFCGIAVAIAPTRVLTADECSGLGVTAVASPATAGLQVAPNPAKGGLFEVTLNSDKDDQAHILITNVLGEQIKDLTIATNKTSEVKIEAAPGIYYISAFTAHGKYDAKVVVE